MHIFIFEQGIKLKFRVQDAIFKKCLLELEFAPFFLRRIFYVRGTADCVWIVALVKMQPHNVAVRKNISHFEIFTNGKGCFTCTTVVL